MNDQSGNREYKSDFDMNYIYRVVVYHEFVQV